MVLSIAIFSSLQWFGWEVGHLTFRDLLVIFFPYVWYKPETVTVGQSSLDEWKHILTLILTVWRDFKWVKSQCVKKLTSHVGSFSQTMLLFQIISVTKKIAARNPLQSFDNLMTESLWRCLTLTDVLHKGGHLFRWKELDLSPTYVWICAHKHESIPPAFLRSFLSILLTFLFHVFLLPESVINVQSKTIAIIILK